MPARQELSYADADLVGACPRLAGIRPKLAFARGAGKWFTGNVWEAAPLANGRRSMADDKLLRQRK
jgi:hypothetical protein